MKFQTHYNRNDFTQGREEKLPTMPSMTIPDQAMPLTEILRRFAQGLPISGQREGIYEGEENDLPDLRRLDLAERQELLEQAEQEVKEITTRLNEKAAKKKNAAMEKKLRENWEKERQENDKMIQSQKQNQHGSNQ